MGRKGFSKTYQRLLTEAEDALLGCKDRTCGAAPTFIGAISWRGAVEDESRVSAEAGDDEVDER